MLLTVWRLCGTRPGPLAYNPMEYFDVLNERGEKTGKVKLRSDVHRDGDWHAAVHIWILNSEGELLMQRRSPIKDTGANMWDISYGGHVQAGNTSFGEAFREGKEELGLDLLDKDLELIFTVTQNGKNEAQTNREFNDVYLVRKDLDSEALVLQEEEVAEVRFMPWQDVRQRIEEHNPEFCQHPDEYVALFEYLDRDQH